jgi:hypothetical protein
MSTETDELLHALEVLRQRWSHNADFEYALGNCIDDIKFSLNAKNEPVSGPFQRVITTTFRVKP